MTTNDELQVILDVEIGHGICPDDETNDTCKLIKVAQLIKADKEQAVLAARIDELKTLMAKHSRTYRQTITDSDGGVYTDDSRGYISKYETQERLAALQQASQKGKEA